MDILGKTELDDGSVVIRIRILEEEREECLVNATVLSYMLKPKTKLEEIIEKEKNGLEESKSREDKNK